MVFVVVMTQRIVYRKTLRDRIKSVVRNIWTAQSKVRRQQALFSLDTAYTLALSHIYGRLFFKMLLNTVGNSAIDHYNLTVNSND